MSVGSDFRAYILTVSNVTNLVGTSKNARVFDRLGSQGGTAPWLLYFVSGGTVAHDIDGLAGAAQTILHTWSYGTDSDNADELDAAVRSALVGTTGLGGRGTMGSTTVMDIQDSGAFWDEEQSRDHSDSYRPYVRRVYTIWHTEATT